MSEVLLGAVLAFIATLIVQFFVAPFADARRRRDEQWFSDVRALMELIGGDVRGQLKSIQATDALRSMRLDADFDATDPKLLRFLDEIERDHRERGAELNRLLTRGSWLSDRILSVDESNPDLMSLHTHWQMARILLRAEAYRPESEVLLEAEQAQSWRKGETRLNEAESHLRCLSKRARPPRKHHRLRFRRRK